jgi:2-oxoisovalerate dehydrogenase E1 component
VLEADAKAMTNGEAAVIVTYGMGVYWAKAAAKEFPGRVTIIDLRTLAPLDEETVMEHRAFARPLPGGDRGTAHQQLRAGARLTHWGPVLRTTGCAVRTLGSVDMPAIPLNSTLEAAMIPSAEKVAKALGDLLEY